MAIPSITSPNGIASASSGTTAAAPQKSDALSRDAFLKLLVAQLSHQDPTQPMEGTEFVAQLSQFAMVEQSVAQSSKLDVLTQQMSGLGNSQATALVGKTVTIHGHGISYDGVLATAANVTLGGASQKTTVTIRDSDGKAVRTMELGPKSAGALSIAWDGRDDSGQQVAKGAYTVDVKATDAKGNAVDASQDVSGVVNKVSFDKGYPELVLDTGAVAPVSDLVSVAVTPPTK
jgi:flagellar basal-body rod modification protein FlgD